MGKVEHAPNIRGDGLSAFIVGDTHAHDIKHLAYICLRQFITYFTYMCGREPGSLLVS